MTLSTDRPICCGRIMIKQGLKWAGKPPRPYQRWRCSKCGTMRVIKIEPTTLDRAVEPA